MESAKRWALVLLSNAPYIHRVLKTIYEARTVGQWKDDIVLLLSSDLVNNTSVKEFSVEFNIIIREVPNRNFDSNLDLWKKHPEHVDYNYVIHRGFMYNKFCIFDTYFKQWDSVFYLDGGAVIQGSLERMKVACPPANCIYAHSDAYPTYEWKLASQFCLELFENKDNKKEFIDTYSPFLNNNYFQGTMCIYDTRIIEPDTVDRLFYLNEKYPIARRMDQGILNLYFNCERNLWKQIPVVDTIGFLYDFHERAECKRRNYLILKYPKYSL
jgi:hypothetical protein